VWHLMHGVLDEVLPERPDARIGCHVYTGTGRTAPTRRCGPTDLDARIGP
jgi:hypothetical protein